MTPAWEDWFNSFILREWVSVSILSNINNFCDEFAITLLWKNFLSVVEGKKYIFFKYYNIFKALLIHMNKMLHSFISEGKFMKNKMHFWFFFFFFPNVMNFIVYKMEKLILNSFSKLISRFQRKIKIIKVLL